ncbi:hypothetical protein Vadar_017163 [Vaccinium darrowii]|uniref:Uncharacterized protein n=1 Tax=Vaccinium darrowii TaxID=229202 RepID=A0ACB7Y7L6_9ERIC|nr:hypothetical protein Vadar_017163 [Vaccinium darrowii]
MSLKSSLLVFLLCISLHASNARRLGAISRKEPAENFLLPNEAVHLKEYPVHEARVPRRVDSDEKVSHYKATGTAKLKPSSISMQTRVDDKNDDHKPMSPEAKDRKKHKEIASPPRPAQSPLRVDDKNDDHKAKNPEAKDMKKHKEIASPPKLAEPPLSETTWLLPPGIPPGQNQPGFNLDYAPPETHPPVNN